MSKLFAISGWLEENSLERIFTTKELRIKAEHIQGMTRIALDISENIKLDRELLELCCLHHDDGRAMQMKLIGNFNDRLLSHNALGLDSLDRYLMANKISVDAEIQVLRDVIYYHGRLGLGEMNIPSASMPYIGIASDADDIENGCIGAVGYLESEALRDEKGYNVSHPEWIGCIKPELFGYYERGEWFDKIVYCHSYAEYFLFAATLAMKSLRKYGNIAKKAMMNPSYGYESALEGYIDLFKKFMDPQDATHASAILWKACRKDWSES